MADEEQLWPAPRTVALAVIAAAGVLDEDPARFSISESERGGARCRFPVLEALKVFYPHRTWTELGRLAGVPKNPINCLMGARKSGWWAEHGEIAKTAAMEALEEA